MQVYIWLGILIFLLFVEGTTLNLVTIWFAGGAFVAAIAALCGANLVVQIILFVVVAIVLLAFTRPWAVKHLDPNTEKTNAEALVGQNAVVIEEIDNLKETGRAKINGMEWTARTAEDGVIIPEGYMAHIVDISGVKLIVEKADEDKLTEEIISNV